MIPKYLTKTIEVTTVDSRLLPARAHASDAGADLRSMENACILPGEMQMLDTGICIAIPVGYVGLVYNRSSQGKIRVTLANSVGVIDSDYRGPVKVLLVNEGKHPYTINAFDTRIAQLVVTPIVLADFIEVTSLNDTSRGTGGFGSTGC